MSERLRLTRAAALRAILAIPVADGPVVAPAADVPAAATTPVPAPADAGHAEAPGPAPAPLPISRSR